MRTAKITSKGQITIPVSVRKELGLSQGDEVEFMKEGERIFLNRRETRIEAAFGLCDARKSAGLQDIEEARARGLSMTAIDTKVLVRLFVSDPGNPEQVETARKAAADAGRIFVPQVVQVEAVRVYRGAFGLEKKEIPRILKHLGNNSAFTLQRPDVYSAALIVYENGTVDFADCVILEEARQAGTRLASFDKRFRGLEGAEVLRS